MGASGFDPEPFVRAAIDACPDACVAFGRDLVVHYWNPAAEALLGWSAEEVVGRIDPTVDEGDRERAAAAVQGMLEGSVGRVPIARRRHRDGSRVVLALRAIFPLGSDVIGVFFREATRDELRLEQRNQLSRELVDAIREEDVGRIVGTAVRDLLGASCAIALAPSPGRADGGLVGQRGIGCLQEEAEQVELSLDDPGAAWARALAGDATVGTLPAADGAETPTAFVPMGPQGSDWVLALRYVAEVPNDAAILALAATVADEAWIAFQRAQLVQDLEGKVEILEATAAVASTAGLDLDHTLSAVTRQAAAALSCERSAIYLRDETGDLRLAHLYATDLDTSTPEGLQLAREVLDRRSQVLVQDVSSCGFVDGPWTPDLGAVSVLALPLTVGDRDIGVLALAHTEAYPRGFTNLCQQVGAAVAQQAALALEHARLFAVEHETVNRLRELDQLKADYVAGITHDLKVPLTGLLGFANTLKRLGDSVGPDERRRYVAVMERQAERLVTMVEDLLMAARMDDGNVDPGMREMVSLHEVLLEALESYAPDVVSRLMLDAHDAEMVVEGNASQLLRVVTNLIDNALKYSPADEPVEISLARRGDEAVLRVRDRGPGVDDSERERIFQRFVRGREGDAQSSTGLGLFISRGIARGHGGELVYEPVDGVGSRFAVRLPLASVVPDDARALVSSD